ncbi:MAG TPA: hypothetical protein VFT37_01495, partial [Telluria sp.]|nr:hypothetical protein [Telluria sp.]
RMGREIDRAPDDASLYSLRARLNDACGYRSPAWRDLQQAYAIAPGDRDAALAVHAYQCRHAVRIAWSLSDDDSDDDAVDAHGAELETQAVAGIWRLMRDYARDTAFALRIIAAFDQSGALRPCDNYGLVLAALAANPASWELRKKEALVLAWLASIGPETDNIPIGYFEDWYGNRLNALAVDRAIAAIDAALLEREDAELLAEKANLLAAMEQLPEATATYKRLIAIYEMQLATASPADRDDVAGRLASARKAHDNCKGGAGSYLCGQESELAASIAQLEKMTSARRVEELKTAADEWRKAAANVKQGPDAKLKAELDRVAGEIAAQTVGLLSEPPVVLRTQDLDDIAGGASPWFDQRVPQSEVAGLAAPVGFEHAEAARKFGSHQGRLWAHPDGRLALIAETASTIRLVRVMSRFSDGTVLLTAGSLGTGLYGAGPKVDMVWVMPDTPVADMITLHSALLARRLAAQPGLLALPIRNVGELALAENILLALKHIFRRGVGITDTEIRGMPVQHPAYFSRVLKAEVAARLAALAQDRAP